MRKLAVLVAISLQVLYLVGLALQREYLLESGTSVYLRTAPVDPRDLFRGDYVTLDYEINTVSADAFHGTVGEHKDDRGHRVYALLESTTGSLDLHGLASLDDRAPESGLFLAGRLEHNWRLSRQGDVVAVRYGIEKLFVEQGYGKEIETKRGTREGMQIPMEVEVAVGPQGDAAIRGFRWSPVGVQLEMLRTEQRTLAELRKLDEASADGEAEAAEAEVDAPADAPADAPVDAPAGEVAEIRAPEVRITLQNVGEETLWLMDPGDHCSFELVSAAAGSRPLPLANSICDAVAFSQDDFHRLDPGDTYAVTLDLDQARWHLWNGDDPTSLTGLGNLANSRFRLAYRPASSWLDNLQTAPGPLWTTEMLTPAFSAVGQID